MAKKHNGLEDAELLEQVSTTSTPLPGRVIKRNFATPPPPKIPKIWIPGISAHSMLQRGKRSFT